MQGVSGAILWNRALARHRCDAGSIGFFCSECHAHCVSRNYFAFGKLRAGLNTDSGFACTGRRPSTLLITHEVATQSTPWNKRGRGWLEAQLRHDGCVQMDEAKDF